MELGGAGFVTILWAVLAIGLATVVTWIGSGYFEGAAGRLAAVYELPAVVQGSVVVAVGSSLPELASVIFAGLAGSFDLGVGAIVGSAIFNVLVIPAVAGLSGSGPLEASRTIVYKEAQFYMIAVATLVITFALAVIYLPVGGESPLVGQLTRPLAILPLALYALYLWIQWQDVGDYHPPARPDDVDIRRTWALFLVGLVIILVGVHVLVGEVESAASALGVPSFLAGVTVVAAATSVPDLLVSVRAANDARGETSLGNVLGSNTFDLLVAIPVGVLLVGTVPIDFAVAAPMMGVLTLATVVLFALLRTDLSLTTAESTLLLLAYGVFVAWVVAESVGLLHFV